MQMATHSYNPGCPVVSYQTYKYRAGVFVNNTDMAKGPAKAVQDIGRRHHCSQE